MKTFQIIIFGKVQGVGFRYFTQKKASNLNIKGWVQNKTNGSVQIYAQGEKIKEFILELKKGPTMSRVSNVEVDSIESEEFSTFQIKGW